MINWTKELVVAQIKIKIEANKSIACSDVIKDQWKLYQAGRRLFGSWKNAVEAAGVENYKNKPKVGRWTKEVIIKKLSDLKNKGKPLDTTSMMKYNEKLYRNATRVFGTWVAALIAAGIDPCSVRKVKRVRIKQPHESRFQLKLPIEE